MPGCHVFASVVQRRVERSTREIDITRGEGGSERTLAAAAVLAAHLAAGIP